MNWTYEQELASVIKLNAELSAELVQAVEYRRALLKRGDICTFSDGSPTLVICGEQALTPTGQRIAELEAENEGLVQSLAARDARIAELDTELALLRRAHPATSVLNPGGTFADKPEHNPFQTFPTDPRRMGP